MLRERAKVIAVDGDKTLVETLRNSVCGSCTVNKVCGSGVIAKALGRQRFQLEVANPVGAAVGDEVIIALEDEVLVKSSLLAYALPLAAMLAGGVFGESLRGGVFSAAGEGLTIGLAAVGLAVGFSLAGRLAGGRIRQRPVILERVGAGDVSFVDVRAGAHRRSEGR